MRVLLLRRQPFGGLAAFTDELARVLGQHGFSAEIEDASEWIPNETGSKSDREPTRRLRERASGYQLAHAFGYRCAWAGAEAFGDREAWVYTAWDAPKTTHRLLIDRLNCAQAGFCVSHGVLQALDRALALDLSYAPPGVEPPSGEVPDRAGMREEIRIPKDGPLVGAMGRWDEESGLLALIESFERVWDEHPEARLAIAGKGPFSEALAKAAEAATKPDRIHLLGLLDDPGSFQSALDLFVAPRTRASVSMAALEAMSREIPVLVRHSGSLPELVDPEISGYLFDSDEQLGSRIAELLSVPLTLETVGRAGRLRVMERFTLEQAAQSVVEVYRTILQDVTP